jgi:hypothetical protein
MYSWFVISDDYDFQLQSNAPMIDAGKEIPGITEKKYSKSI